LPQLGPVAAENLNQSERMQQNGAKSSTSKMPFELVLKDCQAQSFAQFHTQQTKSLLHKFCKLLIRRKKLSFEE
jgi:hypothetical protein